MKLGLYMYDREIELNDNASEEFVQEFENSKQEMIRLLNMFEEKETRLTMFYMVSLRSLIDDFLEYCAEDITVDEMEELLNNEEYEDDGEILIEFNDEEE